MLTKVSKLIRLPAYFILSGFRDEGLPRELPESVSTRCHPMPSPRLVSSGFLSSVERRVCELAARSGVLPRARRSGKRALCGTIRVKRSQRSTSTRARQPFAKQASIKD